MHKHTITTLCLLSVTYIWGAPALKKGNADKNTITTREDRQKWLTTCQDFSQNKKTNISSESTSLFLYIEDEKPIVEEVKEEEIIEEAPKRTELSELLLLKSVGNAIKPRGHVQVNEKYVLCIQNARTLHEGDRFIAEYKQKKFTISVKEISKDNFILQLNAYSLTFKY